MSERNYKYTGGKFEANLKTETVTKIWGALFTAGLKLDNIYTARDLVNIFTKAKLEPRILSTIETPRTRATARSVAIFQMCIQITIPATTKRCNMNLTLS